MVAGGGVGGSEPPPPAKGPAFTNTGITAATTSASPAVTQYFQTCVQKGLPGGEGGGSPSELTPLTPQGVAPRLSGRYTGNRPFRQECACRRRRTTEAVRRA
ncbi:hypothetical protein GCM10010219_03490 [Streptomyces netropsis]|nr:hypothetical protein GCM10010219_03490 [Streptomyces netropsis]